jgi:hypothetical protein
MGRAEESRFGLQEALRSNAPQGGFCHLKCKFLLNDLNARSFNQKTDPVFHKCYKLGPACVYLRAMYDGSMQRKFDTHFGSFLFATRHVRHPLPCVDMACDSSINMTHGQLSLLPRTARDQK